MSDLNYCPEHNPASVMYRSEVCPMCTLEAELKVTFDNMMRYMMFIRDNGHTESYIQYAKDKGYK
jgi:hypothetical protein